MRTQHHKILAAAPTGGEKRLVMSCSRLGVTIAAAAQGETGPAKLDLLAYTGEAMNQWWLDHPVVVDIASLKASRPDMPILRGHDPMQVVGHTTEIELKPEGMKVKGLASGANEHAREVVESARQGMPWQVSIGADPGSIEFIKAGASVVVNGRTFQGPINVSRNAELFEVSIVAIGADQHTSGKLAAQHKGDHVNFEAFCKSLGFDLATITAEKRAQLQAAFDANQTSSGGSPPAPGTTPPAAPKVEAAAPAVPSAPQAADPVMSIRAEHARIAAIDQACGTQHGEIKANAIAQGWSAEKVKTEVELATLRASRAQVPNVIAGKAGPDGQKVLEAALLVQAGMSPDSVAKQYGQTVMDAATHKDIRACGLQGLARFVLAAAGRSTAVINKQALQELKEIRAEGFSAVSFTGILNNTADKMLVESFLAVPSVLAQIASKRSVSDFKAHESYRLNAIGSMEEVGPAGELKHGKLTDTQFSIKAKTIGKILTLTRQDIINDDLGAFMQIPKMLGRMAAIAKEKNGFTKILANASSFFGTGNKNYISGGTSALSISAVTLALQKFREQTDANGDPILLEPAILMVPPALEVYAKQICTEQRVNETTTANAPKLANNPHAGSLRAVVAPFLGTKPALSGSSDTAWYLLANPADQAVIEIAYLNGNENPVIEEVPCEADVLGYSWRGYFDFDTALKEYRAGVLAAGA